jgi:hypothetical protein
MVKYITVRWFLMSTRTLLCLKVPILHTCLPSEKSSIQRKIHMQHWWKDSGIKKRLKKKMCMRYNGSLFLTESSIRETDPLVLYRETDYLL